MACKKQYQKSIIDAYNTASQTIKAGDNVVFNGISVDSGSSIQQTNSTDFTIINSGIYGVRFTGNLYNSTSSPVTVQIQLTSNGNSIAGTLQNITVPETGYAPIVITKDVLVTPTTLASFVKLDINAITEATFVEANITIEKKA